MPKAAVGGRLHRAGRGREAGFGLAVGEILQDDGRFGQDLAIVEFDRRHT
jgi:hypothetical protein